MSNLQSVVFGAASDGSQGDSTRIAFTKDNANVAVLNAQAFLTSFATTLTAGQALTAASHLGKRVNINVSTAQTFNLPTAASCGADGVILLRNLGTISVTLAVTASSGDTIALTTLNGLETALFDTDGVHAWNVLVRGRGTSANETVNGNSTVLGNETVGGTLAVTGSSTLAALSTTGMTNSGNQTTAGTLGVSGRLSANGGISITGGIIGATSVSGAFSVSSGTLTVYQTNGTSPAATMDASGNIGCVGTITGASLNVTGAATIQGTGTALTVSGSASVGGAAVGTGVGLSVTGTYPFQTRAANASSGYFWMFGGDSSSSFAIRAGGASGIGVYVAYNANSWAATSDGRLKNIRSNITGALQSVSAIRTVRYSWKKDDDHATAMGLSNDSRIYVGVIAQDVLAQVPEAVSKTEDGYLGVSYTDLVPLCLAAIKELTEKVAALEARAA